MHDPSTLAFEIRFPGKRRKLRGPWDDGRFAPFLEVWHIDPCRGGGDDSCGYVFPRVPQGENEFALKLGRGEWPFMFGADHATLRGASTLEVVYAIWRVLLWRMPPELKRDHLTARELKACMDVSSAPMDNFQEHVKRAKVSAEECAELFSLVWRLSCRARRPWWQHPRFHVHHWEIRCPQLTDLKRFLFSRCAGCGGRFGYGESPYSNSWHGSGPRWFRGETHVYHSGCLEQPGVCEPHGATSSS